MVVRPRASLSQHDAVHTRLAFTHVHIHSTSSTPGSPHNCTQHSRHATRQQHPPSRHGTNSKAMPVQGRHDEGGRMRRGAHTPRVSTLYTHSRCTIGSMDCASCGTCSRHAGGVWAPAMDAQQQHLPWQRAHDIGSELKQHTHPNTCTFDHAPHTKTCQTKQTRDALQPCSTTHPAHTLRLCFLAHIRRTLPGCQKTPTLTRDQCKIQPLLISSSCSCGGSSLAGSCSMPSPPAPDLAAPLCARCQRCCC